MKASVNPSKISGSIQAPLSKSAMQRACAAALVRNGKSILQNPGRSADDLAALDIIRQLGAAVQEEGGSLVIDSQGVKPVGDRIHCGESGLSIRMFTSIAALSGQSISVTGGGSLTRRPMNFFDKVLPELGVSVSSKSGYLPLQIKGPLKPANITVDGSLSSQYLTGLLFAYAAAGASGVTISVDNLASKPYIDLTLEVLRAFGLKLPQNKDYREFYFDSSEVKPVPSVTYSVEGDWSGAAFLLVAGSIAGGIEIKGLDVFSTQADKAVLQALMSAEAVMSIQQDRIEVRPGKLRAFHFNATDCPDLFPPLVALAAYCEGTSVIEGVHRLTHKESNRSLTLQEEFGKLGIDITLQDDLMIIKGTGIIKEAAVHSHEDHRIAMACAVAALKAQGPVAIEGAEAVKKSYPQFWDDLQKMGAHVTIF
jgi:3-phosphoshikimate 1-carboxyvinyltransferase